MQYKKVQKSIIIMLVNTRLWWYKLGPSSSGPELCDAAAASVAVGRRWLGITADYSVTTAVAVVTTAAAAAELCPHKIRQSSVLCPAVS